MTPNATYPRRFLLSLLASDTRGAVLLGGLLVMTVLVVLGASAIRTSMLQTRITENYFAGIQVFYATEAGVTIGVNHLSADIATSIQPIPVTNIGNLGYQYRSGRQNDPGPQPLQFVGTMPESGYSIGNGTGYNPTGYVFYVYQINATGMGPKNNQEELEVLATYGPIAH